MKTYHVSGRLVSGLLENEYGSINQEVQAEGAQAALALFENDEWEFLPGTAVRHISEAEKMERTGQPTLFALEDYNANRL
jgi:hypothetical protein